ncbi:disease resistance protein RPM1-like [Papaver somniferum]|uniref:disease resistance protein RPM1-like n=1 Tax=Papaver somniferum TaxID=3469 RepID=UPI000E6FF92C|nr:disease resistance protein RPM1-like [Papaver somniferum]
MGELPWMRKYLHDADARHTMDDGPEIQQIIEIIHKAEDIIDDFFFQRRIKRRPVVEELNVVGMVDSIKQVTSLLIPPNSSSSLGDHNKQRRMVISIVGMGGLGKTTVATNIYKSKNTERYFDVSAWVYVSQEFRVVDLLCSIIGQVTRNSYHNINEKDEGVLRVMLYNYLEERRHKRILVTTRSLEVARFADPSHDNIHVLRLLDSGERGILLIKDKTLAAWSKVHDSVNWELTHGEKSYLCSGILAFSYYDMPYYLKPCFMNTGLFPEDHEIRASKLFHLWIAEWFVQREGEKTLEDTAEDYLEELIHRSLIKIERRRYDGRVKTCRIHDLLRDLANAKSKKLRFLQRFQIANSAGLSRAVWMTLIIKGKCIFMPDIWSLHQLRHLDVDFTFSEEHRVLSNRHLVIDNLTNLQTLSISNGFWINDVRWDRLKMLRKFSITTFGQHRFRKEFVDSIAAVRSLQSLKLMFGKEIQIATQLAKNTNLTKLYLRGPLPKFSFPSNLVKLILSSSDRSDTDLMEVLRKLTRFKFLEFRPLSYTARTMTFSAGLFVRLQSLEIAGFPDLCELIMEDGSLISLTHLVIRSCGLLRKLPERIEQLQLQVLQLNNMHPRLTDRLKENVGENWDQIKHISSVVITQ